VGFGVGFGLGFGVGFVSFAFGGCNNSCLKSS
jgi:hypothetical protein